MVHNLGLLPAFSSYANFEVNGLYNYNILTFCYCSTMSIVLLLATLDTLDSLEVAPWRCNM
jgi:hypothetical protein